MSAKEQTDTPTPRTDALERELESDDDHYYSRMVDHAKEIETELTALQSDVRRLVGAINQTPVGRQTHRPIKAALESLLANNPSLKPE